MTITQAEKAGIQAFDNGRQAAPALNQSFLVDACKSQIDTASLFAAYIHGWTVAHLAKGMDSQMPSALEVARIKAA